MTLTSGRRICGGRYARYCLVLAVTDVRTGPLAHDAKGRYPAQCRYRIPAAVAFRGPPELAPASRDCLCFGKIDPLR